MFSNSAKRKLDISASAWCDFEQPSVSVVYQSISVVAVCFTTYGRALFRNPVFSEIVILNGRMACADTPGRRWISISFYRCQRNGFFSTFSYPELLFRNEVKRILRVT